MIERQRHSSLRQAPGRRPAADAPTSSPTGRCPGSPSPARSPDEPTILGFPAEVGADRDAGRRARWTDPPPDGPNRTGRRGPPGHPAARRPGRRARARARGRRGAREPVGAVVARPRDTGWSLVRRGLTLGGSGVGELGRSDLWQPLAIVLGGVLLLLLGVVLLLPEHPPDRRRAVPVGGERDDRRRPVPGRPLGLGFRAIRAVGCGSPSRCPRSAASGR